MADCYDVIIIGAGVMGASIALELARSGRSTLNLDAGPAVGAAGRCGAEDGCRSTLDRWHLQTGVGGAAAEQRPRLYTRERRMHGCVFTEECIRTTWAALCWLGCGRRQFMAGCLWRSNVS